MTVLFSGMPDTMWSMVQTSSALSRPYLISIAELALIAFADTKLVNCVVCVLVLTVQNLLWIMCNTISSISSCNWKAVLTLLTFFQKFWEEYATLEASNWVAVYGKFYSHLSQDVNRPVKNGSWSAEIKLLKDMR